MKTPPRWMDALSEVTRKNIWPTDWRKYYHYATFYGFLLCFASTSTATLYHYLAGREAPYAEPSGRPRHNGRNWPCRWPDRLNGRESQTRSRARRREAFRV